MSSINFETLSQELMRALRGDQPQRTFSRTLGFTSNVAYTWETGRRAPEASVFLRAAALRRSGFGRRMLAVLELNASGSNPARLGTPRAVHRLVGQLARSTPVGELGRQLGVDRTTAARWLRGETEPRLTEFLRLVEIGTQQLLPFVALIADPGELSATRSAHRDLLLQQRLAYDLPWSHALLRALELDVYTRAASHDGRVLAAAIGMPESEVASTLEVLDQAGQIAWTGSHYRTCRVMAVDTRPDPVRNLQLKAHWSRVGTERIGDASSSKDALFSFNLFAVTEEALTRIRQLHLDYYERVRAIVDEVPGSDRVVLMNLQLIPLERAQTSNDEKARAAPQKRSTAGQRR